MTDFTGNVFVLSTSVLLQSPDTTITSAVDGNGKSVENNTSTTSNSIAFHVTHTKGSKPITGFECSFDGRDYSNCSAANNSTTIIANNLPAGKHTFMVRAVDSEGNVDPNSAIFVWTILTPTQGIQNLIDTIEKMHISKAVKTSLETPLKLAEKFANNHQKLSECSSLFSFNQEVNAFQLAGQLTKQQASDLREQAAAIEQSLRCKSSTMSFTFSYSAPTSSDSSISPLSSSLQSPDSDSSSNRDDGQPYTSSQPNNFFSNTLSNLLGIPINSNNNNINENTPSPKDRNSGGSNLDTYSDFFQ